MLKEGLKQLKEKEIKIPQEMSEEALKKMKEFNLYVEKARIPYERSLTDLPAYQKEIFQNGLKLLSAVSRETSENKVKIKEQAEVIKGLNQEERLQELINLAFNENPIKASKIVLQLNDADVEYKFFDVLNQYNDNLKRQGKF